MKKRVIAIVGALVLVTGLFFGGRYLINTMRYRQIISDIALRTPDLTQIQDGTFHGSFDAILVSADVNVTVENHRIVEIVINEHSHGNWDAAPEAEVVIDDVILLQSIEEVDTISGATNSSKVILSAVQVALENAVEVRS